MAPGGVLAAILLNAHPASFPGLTRILPQVNPAVFFKLTQDSGYELVVQRPLGKAC